MATPQTLKRNLRRLQTHSPAASPLVGRKALANTAGKHFGGERDLYEVMGYPRYIDAAEYVNVYERQDLAQRIVDAYPDATWREPPEVKGDDKFKQGFAALCKRLKIWRQLHRLDRLMNIGHYGVLFLGLDGAEATDQAATKRNYELLYVQPHSERTAQVIKWNDNANSPRYGMPELYRITTGVNWTGSGAGQKSLTVHHTRVIHVAERALEDVSIGTPRLKAIYNRLMDLDKLLGGSAEMYWQNSAMIMQFNADAAVEWDEDERAELSGHLEEMQHQLRRFLRTRGIDAQNLAPGLQGADPSNHIDKQLDVIAGTTGIPKRILIGNEAGELASTQDETNWQGRVAERREQTATPVFIDALVSRLTKLGVLSGEFQSVEWPESDTLGEKGRAEVAKTTAEALSAYTLARGADLIVKPDEFRKILGYDDLKLVPVAEPDMGDTVPDAEAEASDNPEDQALNGAQITAIKEIAEAVALKQLPMGTAVQLIKVGFPFISEAMAKAIIDPMVDFSPEDMRNNQKLPVWRRAR